LESRAFIKKARETGTDEKAMAASDQLLGRLAKMKLQLRMQPVKRGKK